MDIKPLSIFILNCDWRDIFNTSFIEFRDKLERDRLGARINNFSIFSWARTSYMKTIDNYASVHKKTRLDVIRPILDIYSIPSVLFFIWKNKIKSDVWLCYDFGFLPALWFAKKILGGKLVICLNNQPRVYSRTRKLGTIKSFYSWLIEKLFSGLPDHFFTINETMREYIKKLGVVDSKISVFSMNTIIRDREFIDKIKKGSIIKKYNIPDSYKIILTVARLEAEKNYDTLLNLFAGLGDGYVLFALGRGSLLSELTKQCQSLGIQDRVFFPGFVHRDEIWNYYADADVFVLLSNAEALGVVLWEAMYMNVPVIGSNADGIVETIGADLDRGRIWTIDMGQIGFNKIIADISEYSDMKTRAKNYVEEKISNKLLINDIV